MSLASTTLLSFAKLSLNNNKKYQSIDIFYFQWKLQGYSFIFFLHKIFTL